MQKVKLGTKVPALGINRLMVAEGVMGRAVLIDPDPRVKYIAYDESVKRKVEVTKELMIKYGLSPSTVFFYLVGRLNTDMKGNIVSDDMVLEYVQLSENLNNEFAGTVTEMGGTFTSLAISKVKKTGNDGKDYSYLKVIPSNTPISAAIQQKVETLRSNPESIEAVWEMIDSTTSITPEAYEELKMRAGTQGQSMPMIESAPAYAPPAIGSAQPASLPPTPPPPAVGSGGTDEFEGFGDFEDLPPFN